MFTHCAVDAALIADQKVDAMGAARILEWTFAFLDMLYSGLNFHRMHWNVDISVTIWRRLASQRHLSLYPKSTIKFHSLIQRLVESQIKFWWTVNFFDFFSAEEENSIIEGPVVLSIAKIFHTNLWIPPFWIHDVLRNFVVRNDDSGPPTIVSRFCPDNLVVQRQHSSNTRLTLEHLIVVDVIGILNALLVKWVAAKVAKKNSSTYTA